MDYITKLVFNYNDKSPGQSLCTVEQADFRLNDICVCELTSDPQWLCVAVYCVIGWFLSLCFAHIKSSVI